ARKTEQDHGHWIQSEEHHYMHPLAISRRDDAKPYIAAKTSQPTQITPWPTQRWECASSVLSARPSLIHSAPLSGGCFGQLCFGDQEPQYDTYGTDSPASFEGGGCSANPLIINSTFS